MQTKDKVKWTIKLGSFAGLALIFFTFTQCVEEMEVEKVEVVPVVMPDDPNHNGGGSGDSGLGDVTGGGSIISEFNENGATEVARTSTSIGIKDFEQIHKTMSVLTGINPANERDVRDVYGELSTQLPNENDVKQFNNSIQFAIFKLGSAYCDVMLDDSNYYNAVFTSINVGSSPNQVLNNQAGKLNLVNDLINRFWGAGVQDAAIVSQTQTDLVALLDDLLTGEDLGRGATTRKVAKGVCASLIATPPVIML